MATKTIKPSPAERAEENLRRAEERRRVDRAVKELQETVMRRANVSKKDILDVAVRRFVANNLDLLTPAEKEYFTKQGLVFS